MNKLDWFVSYLIQEVCVFFCFFFILCLIVVSNWIINIYFVVYLEEPFKGFT